VYVLRLSRLSFLFTFLFLALAVSALAQNPTGGVRGTVADPWNAVVPNAAITITNKATGTERQITNLQPGEYELNNTALTFLKGHRARLIVSSSNYPKYAINLNDGGAMYKKGNGLVATNRVYVSKQHPSALLLPVVAGGGEISAQEREAGGEATRRAGKLEVIRTPDERFANLPGYNFKPHYVEVQGLRMHYVDEGPPSAPPVLLLHGEPSWSYLYRKMIPILTAAGHRVIAPDFIGFGRSDKPVRREDYTYQLHVDTLASLLRQLKLREITLVCQDWGGLIGLRVAAENPDRFARIVAANTGLPTGDRPPGEAFMRWQQFSQTVKDFNIGNLIKQASRTEMPPEVVAAYNAPFPDDRYKAGARVFPMLVPTKPDDPASAANRKAWEVLRRWEKPFLTAFSDGDAITRGGEVVFQQQAPGAKGQPHVTIKGAGHFLQEDKGEELARVVVDFIARTRSRPPQKSR
jgi:haloalkane dehalogenase